MLRLLYISTTRPGVDQRVLNDILAKSRSNNRSHGLTGLLAFDGKRFMQYLEGDAEAVRRTYVRILADPRHFAIVKLRETTGTERQFCGWDMAVLSTVTPAEFDRHVAKITELVENCDVLTAAEIKGFVLKLAA